ncbi:MAG: two-component system response regulator YesN [Bacteriovoracaceae bacterium]|jgi:two-component system response regulator YesN
MKLLFVEDHQDLLDIYKIEITYELKGIPSFFALSGEAALEILENEEITHVFTDAKMPKMSGIELTKEIVKKWPMVDVFMISGYPGQYTQEELKDIGIKKFFEKPISFDELFDFIKTL